MSLTTVIVIVWLVLWFTRCDESPRVIIVREERERFARPELEYGTVKHSCSIPGCTGTHRAHV